VGILEPGSEQAPGEVDHLGPGPDVVGHITFGTYRNNAIAGDGNSSGNRSCRIRSEHRTIDEHEVGGHWPARVAIHNPGYSPDYVFLLASVR
jgi:hypothetical protein